MLFPSLGCQIPQRVFGPADSHKCVDSLWSDSQLHSWIVLRWTHCILWDRPPSLRYCCNLFAALICPTVTLLLYPFKFFQRFLSLFPFRPGVFQRWNGARHSRLPLVLGCLCHLSLHQLPSLQWCRQGFLLPLLCHLHSPVPPPGVGTTVQAACRASLQEQCLLPDPLHHLLCHPLCRQCGGQQGSWYRGIPHLPCHVCGCHSSALFFGLGTLLAVFQMGVAQDGSKESSKAEAPGIPVSGSGRRRRR